MQNFSHNPLPLYAQVESKLAINITNGQWSVGSRLPSEDELITQFKVSRPTVRKAIQNLASRGLVEIHRGVGTFVTQPKITQELTELTGFVEDMQAIGRKATARVIDKRIVKSNDSIAQHLGLPVGTSVVKIQRVRLADGIAISFDETYLPKDIGQKIMRDDLESEPIFSLLEEKYDLPLIEAIYKLEAAVATDEVAHALGIAPLSPIFLIERTSYCAGKTPIDYEKLFYRGDLIRFETRLRRNPSNRKKHRKKS
jgi:GntR family transcriptional regulator